MLYLFRDFTTPFLQYKEKLHMCSQISQLDLLKVAKEHRGRAHRANHVGRWEHLKWIPCGAFLSQTNCLLLEELPDPPSNRQLHRCQMMSVVQQAEHDEEFDARSANKGLKLKNMGHD